MKHRLACPLMAAILLGVVLAGPSHAFATLDDGWDGPGKGSYDLTYFFGTLTNSSGLAVADVKAALIVAMDAWAEYAVITFTETTTGGLDDSIDFHFGHGGLVHPLETGSFAPGAIAHAFSPGVPPGGGPPLPFEPGAGDVHFNDDTSVVTYEIGDVDDTKMDLTLVAVHEIGHALGLAHSAVSTAVMTSILDASVGFTALDPDDIAGIQSIYRAVPEPSSLLLVGLAALGLVGRARRRARAGPTDEAGDPPV